MFNRTRSLEVDPGPRPAGRGPCHCYLYEQDPVVHDMLLGFEGKGMAGIVELLDYVETAPDFIDSPISHLDIPDWAAEHRWEDPRGVMRLTTALCEAQRLRCQLREATTRMEAAASVLKGR